MEDDDEVPASPLEDAFIPSSIPTPEHKAMIQSVITEIQNNQDKSEIDNPKVGYEEYIWCNIFDSYCRCGASYPKDFKLSKSTTKEIKCKSIDCQNTCRFVSKNGNKFLHVYKY